MKRASYKAAIDWIAQNDNAGGSDSAEGIAGYISTCLVADLFDVPNDDVAEAVAKRRVKLGLTVGSDEGGMS